MQKFLTLLALSALFGAPSPAQTPALLISATQHSGYTRPQQRFSISCRVTEDGKLHADLWSDQSTGQWGRHQVVDRTLSAEELNQLQLQVQESVNGPFEHGQNPCDVGGTRILGHQDGVEISLVNSNDCGPRTVNLSTSAKKLAAWVRKECKLK